MLKHLQETYERYEPILTDIHIEGNPTKEAYAEAIRSINETGEFGVIFGTGDHMIETIILNKKDIETPFPCTENWAIIYNLPLALTNKKLINRIIEFLIECYEFGVKSTGTIEQIKQISKIQNPSNFQEFLKWFGKLYYAEKDIDSNIGFDVRESDLYPAEWREQ